MPIIQVKLGDDISQAIPDPTLNPKGGLSWRVNYSPGDDEAMRCGASVIAGFQYLLSDEISMEEAIRRLRLLRKAYRDAPRCRPNPQDHPGRSPRVHPVVGRTEPENRP
jgi:hypothetical protein